MTGVFLCVRIDNLNSGHSGQHLFNLLSIREINLHKTNHNNFLYCTVGVPTAMPAAWRSVPRYAVWDSFHLKKCFNLYYNILSSNLKQVKTKPHRRLLQISHVRKQV